MNTRAEFSPPHVEQLVVSSRAGDAIAFGQLMGLHKDRIYGFVSRRIPDPVEAEDLTQETFVRAYRALPAFRGASGFYTWLRCIAANVTIDATRRRQRYGGVLSLDAPIEIEGRPLARDFAAPSYCQPDREVETAELQREVHRAIRSLPPKLRTVVVLYELQGFSYKQIATAIGCPVGTVKSRMYHARDQLKQNLLHAGARQFLAGGFAIGDFGGGRSQPSPG